MSAFKHGMMALATGGLAAGLLAFAAIGFRGADAAAEEAVNPVTLKRVEKLFCKNERAVIKTRLSTTGHALTLVPVAAILVAGIRLRFLDIALRSGQPGRRTFPCDAILRKGEEMGWFEHGSTIIVLAPEGFRCCDTITEGMTIRAGQPLLRLLA